MSSFLERFWYPERPEPLPLRIALSPFWAMEGFFRAAVAARAALYRRGAIPVIRVDGVRVISVGNLNVGGAGKTPAVIHIARRLLARGERVAVLSRGYGRSAGPPVVIRSPEGADPRTTGDEPLLIARRCPGAVVLVGPRRGPLAIRARDELGATAVVLDDGLQHRRLHRDVDIAVVDAAAGFGNGHLLPRGPLREPPSALERASLVWLRDGSGAGPSFDRPAVRVRHVASAAISPDGQRHPASALAGRPVLALSGIARPGAFARTLRELGAELVSERAFGDHHFFSASELASAAREAERLGAIVVTTEKDAVRLPPGSGAWAVELDVRIDEGEALLDAALFGR